MISWHGVGCIQDDLGYRIASGLVPPAIGSLTVSGQCGLFMSREVHGNWELGPAAGLARIWDSNAGGKCPREQLHLNQTSLFM